MRRAALVLALAVLVAALSLVLHAVPGFDPQGWLLWGREITGGGLHALSTTAYPSWKPLPALVTTPLSLTGTAAPALWLLVARTGAILAAVLAYRLAARFAGPIAGVVAVAGVLLLDGWWTYAARGAIEPLLAALVLGAADRHLAGRRGQAAALLGLAALGRHEAFALYGAYGLAMVAWPPLGLRSIGRGVALAAGAGAIVALWLGGDYLGSGDPFHGTVLARQAQETILAQRAGDLSGATVRAMVGLVGLPLVLAALAAVPLAWRRRERGVLVLVGAVALWLVVDLVMAHRGYPAIPRFMIPAGAVIAVAGAVGIVWLVESLAELAGRAPWPAARWAVAALVVAAAVPAVLATPGKVVRQVRGEVAYVHAIDGLDAAVTHAPGIHRILAEGWITTEHAFQTRLAWRLGVSSSDVHRRLRGPGLAFSLGREPYPGLQRVSRVVRVRRIRHIDGWTVWRVAPARPA